MLKTNLFKQRINENVKAIKSKRINGLKFDNISRAKKFTTSTNKFKENFKPKWSSDIPNQTKSMTSILKVRTRSRQNY